MRIALFSDIHANLRAFQACLADAKKQGFDQIAILGDSVDYGAEPAAVVELVMQLYEEGAWVVQGNHDEAAVYPPIGEGRVIGDLGIAWTHAQLSAQQLNFLRDLPLTYKFENILLVHASAYEPSKWHYVHNAMLAQRSLNAAKLDRDIRYVFGGHVHQQTLYYKGSKDDLMPFQPTAGIAIPVPAHRYWVATVGSCGQPRDGRTEAMYALFDTTAQRLCFRRVAYDYLAAAASIRRIDGLPEFFASRLELGK